MRTYYSLSLLKSVVDSIGERVMEIMMPPSRQHKNFLEYHLFQTGRAQNTHAYHIKR